MKLMRPYSSIIDDFQLSREELRRYGRHLIIPEVGLEGQRRLKSASVAVIGLGGLGSPVALYLAASGIGRLGLVDYDTVDQTNLHRQVIHSTENVGRSKLESARDRIKSLNPNVELNLHQTRLNSQNALEVLAEYDVIVDGTDNFPTRYLVNDACVLLRKPNVYGSIFRFEGQVSVFDPAMGPCYRCLYSEPPPPGLVPTCAEGGVLGVLPGIIGAIQANEAIKLVLGIGEPLVGRLLLFDALKLEFRELKLRKDPTCPICGENPTIRALIDYEAFCGYGAQETRAQEYRISAEELKRQLDENANLVLLDVREPHEHEIVDIGGLLIPLNELPSRVHELNSAQEIIVYCHYGQRSERAVKFLRDVGFGKVKNLEGGIDRWAEVIDPRLARY